MSDIKFYVRLEKVDDHCWSWDWVTETEPTDSDYPNGMVVNKERITKWIEHYASTEMAEVLRKDEPSDDDMDKIWEWLNDKLKEVEK